MRNLKIGLAGCGWIATNGHIPAFSKLKNIELLSVFDIDILRARDLAEQFKISNYFNNYNAFLQSGIDAVIITTPNYTHGVYTLAALENRKHVLCEKPFTIHSEQAEKISELSEKNNVVVMPAFVNRFRDEIKIMSKQILENLGDIKQVDAGWIRKSGVPRPGTWFTNKELSGGGVLIDLGSHIVDLCLMITGMKQIRNLSLRTSYGMSEGFKNSASWFSADYNSVLPINVEDFAAADIEFNDNTGIHIKLSWQAPVTGDCTYFNVVGSEGSLNLKTLFGFSNERLWKNDMIIINSINKSESFYLDGNLNKSSEAFSEMAQQFIKKILQGESTCCLSHRDGYNTVRLIEELYNVESTGSIELPQFMESEKVG